MYAVVIYGKEDYRYEYVPEPRAREEEVVVKIGKCGICASDIKLFRGTAHFAEDVYANAPIIAGHEFIGEVVELGVKAREKHRLEIGDKAIMEQVVPCKKCYYCNHSLYHLCSAKKFVGEIGVDGGWAEYMLYPRDAIIHKIPRNMTWDQGVLIEPLACAIHGVRRVKVASEEIVLIMGAGTIGLLMVQVVKLKNPKLVIVADPLEYRLKRAEKLGADVTVNPLNEDLLKIIKETTGDLGCDAVLETSGSPSAAETAIMALRKGGRLLIFGVYDKKVSLDLNMVGEAKELEIVGSSLAPNAYPLAIEFLHRGLVKADLIVTHNFPLKKWYKAMKVAEKKLDNAIKVTMTPP